MDVQPVGHGWLVGSVRARDLVCIVLYGLYCVSYPREDMGWAALR